MSLKRLRRKLVGMDAKIGRMVADMANSENGTRIRGWIDVRPFAPRDPLDAHAGTRWIAYLHVTIPDGQEFKVAVVRDEKDRVVDESTQPDVFTTMKEAEDTANEQLPLFIAHIKGQLPNQGKPTTPA